MRSEEIVVYSEAKELERDEEEKRREWRDGGIRAG